eukprot:CAMPEP_0118927390 /NCGR_PEP_ID=MMETSP1169-20130426/4874_1 /TAXON_ID=36882 /ORGANISM="Pyramimonas obovata, Strain CCMP722" /LENGTH=32 /DNA_ID= /DNA_START= /DNA_END= /DNA_ORIENTATION=
MTFKIEDHKTCLYVYYVHVYLPGESEIYTECN